MYVTMSVCIMYLENHSVTLRSNKISSSSVLNLVIQTDRVGLEKMAFEKKAILRYIIYTFITLLIYELE